MRKGEMPSLLDKLKDAADAKGIRVMQDVGGICIARETEVDGRIYFHALEIRDQDIANCGEAFELLDRRFASLLANEGLIPLPPKFGGTSE